MGADFDGDTAAVFAMRPDEHERAVAVRPSQIGRHDFWQTYMFKPGKQYLYGLHLLTTRDSNKTLVERFKTELSAAGAPAWASSIDEWCARVADSEIKDGSWWGIVEKYALLGLAADPGMNLGLFLDPKEVLGLDVIDCKAAKSDYYRDNDGNRVQQKLTAKILAGEGLQLFPEIDPIGTVMAPAQKLKGTFGNQFRHLVLKARTVDSRTSMAAQALTEQLTQRVLSIKAAGEELPSDKDYTTFLKPLWLRRKSTRLRRPRSKSNLKRLPPQWVSDITSSPGWGIIKEVLNCDDQKCRPLPWHEWLFAPDKLLDLLQPGEPWLDGAIQMELPLDDLRAINFLARAT